VAIKPPELLNRLPSVSELLDKPPVRKLVERWNRSAVAGGVKSFLDELRSDLQRRAAEVNIPSIRELAERAAQHVASRYDHALGVAINATGRIWSAPWTSPPLADAALERMVAVGREYALDSQLTRDKSTQVEALLCRLSGAPAAAVVHSYAGAVWLALASVAADREVLIARSEVGDVGTVDTLPKLAQSAKAILTEVGATNCALAADYEAAASRRTAAIMQLSSDSYRIIGQSTAAQLDELVAIARERELVSIDALGTAPLVDPPPAVTWPRRSARASLAAGTDLVLLRGDGLLGGPASGIVLGTQQAVSRVTSHPLFAAWSLDPQRAAALAGTLECYENSTGGIDSIPVWQCLTVSIDNLRNRAERIAPQLAQSTAIGTATPIETRSPISAALPDGLPSHAISLSPADGNAEALDERLRSARFPIHARRDEGRIILDLRTVLPRQDTVLIEAITLGPPSTTTA